MTGNPHRDPFAVDRTMADLATSRAAQFLGMAAFPWSDRIEGVTEAMGRLYDRALAAGAARPLVDERQAAAALTEGLGGTPAEGEDALDWFISLPSPDRQRCAFYWHSVLFLTNAGEIGAIEGVRPDHRAALAAAIARRPFEGESGLMERHAAYLDATDGYERLEAALADWRLGPFSDRDLALARAFDWDVAEGGLWIRWGQTIDYGRITALWRTLGEALAPAERKALVAWKRAHAEAAAAPTGDAALDAALSDPIFADLRAGGDADGPPCHPDAILRAHA